VLGQLLVGSRDRTIQGLMFIDGRWTRGAANDTSQVLNPASEEAVATVPSGHLDDAQAALEAAHRAQPAWAAVPAVERGRLVAALADAVRAQTDGLARLVVSEQGKPLNQAKGEVGAAETFLRYAAEMAVRIEGDIFPSNSRNEEVWIRRVPHGVVVGLTAWNYPLAACSTSPPESAARSARRW
jgi:lactaldehyde dehydrogenase/glycolaldehyde dehydrogenase